MADIPENTSSPGNRPLPEFELMPPDPNAPPVTLNDIHGVPIGSGSHHSTTIGGVATDSLERSKAGEVADDPLAPPMIRLMRSATVQVQKELDGIDPTHPDLVTDAELWVAGSATDLKGKPDVTVTSFTSSGNPWLQGSYLVAMSKVWDALTNEVLGNQVVESGLRNKAMMMCFSLAEQVAASIIKAGDIEANSLKQQMYANIVNASVTAVSLGTSLVQEFGRSYGVPEPKETDPKYALESALGNPEEKNFSGKTNKEFVEDVTEEDAPDSKKIRPRLLGASPDVPPELIDLEREPPNPAIPGGKEGKIKTETATDPANAGAKVVQAKIRADKVQAGQSEKRVLTQEEQAQVTKFNQEVDDYDKTALYNDNVQRRNRNIIKKVEFANKTKEFKEEVASRRKMYGEYTGQVTQIIRSSTEAFVNATQAGAKILTSQEQGLQEMLKAAQSAQTNIQQEAAQIFNSDSDQIAKIQDTKTNIGRSALEAASAALRLH